MPVSRSNMSHKKRRDKALIRPVSNIEDEDMDVVTDSEDEYTETEKKLLEKVRKRRTPENFDSDDEVYTLQNESEEEEQEEDEQDSMESDIEELQEDYDIPDDRAWGNEAKNFYSSDYKYTDYTSATEKDFTNAEMEEQEAKKLQTRLADEIFDVMDDRFVQTAEDSNDNEEDSQEIMEFSKLNKKHNEVFEKKESRAFTALITDFKENLTEVNEVLIPFLKLVENGTCPNCDAITFVRTRYHVILNYCTNISFYLMLKAKGLSVQSHPVIKRLEQYRQLLNQLQSGQEDLLEQVKEIVKTVKEGKPLYSLSDDSEKLYQKNISKSVGLNKKLTRQKKAAKQNKKKELDSTDIIDSMDIEEKYDGNDTKNERNSILNAANQEEEKRAITYEIAKNKGLTPYRKKEQRNPRVKYRNKYLKAKIRRKGAVKQVRSELTRYTGEISGIKAGVMKSILLK